MHRSITLVIGLLLAGAGSAVFAQSTPAPAAAPTNEASRKVERQEGCKDSKGDEDVGEVSGASDGGRWRTGKSGASRPV